MNTFKVIGGDNKPYGPVSANEVRNWIAQGRLNGQSLVLPEGSPEWVPLASLLEFADALRSGAQSPPPPLPGNPEAVANDILARPTGLSIGDCLSAGFKFAGANFGFVAGSIAVVEAIKVFFTISGFVIPFVPGIAQFLLNGVFLGGLYYAWLRRARGEAVGIGNIFDGFKLCFLQLMLAGVISQLLAGVGFIFCILPGLYLIVAWLFATPLVADKRLEFWSAMELSRKVVTRVWFQVFLLLVIAFLPVIAVQIVSGFKVFGVMMDLVGDSHPDPARVFQTVMREMPRLIKLSVLLATVHQIVLYLNMLFAFGALVRAYETLFGARKS